jgi:hypothetical protein
MARDQLAIDDGHHDAPVARGDRAINDQEVPSKMPAPRIAPPRIRRKYVAAGVGPARRDRHQ